MQRRLDLIFVAACLVVVLGHAANLNRPYVNLEYAFAGAARTLADPGYAEGLERYFQVQANPLGYSIFASLLLRIVDTELSFWPARVPSLIGALLMLASGWLICRQMKVKPHVFCMWAAATMTNPLIWLYSGQATADMLPAGLICLSFALCYLAGLDRSRWWMDLIAGLLFSLSIISKYNMILLGAGFILLLLLLRATDTQAGPAGSDSPNTNNRPSRKRFVIRMLYYAVLPAVAIVTYLLLVDHFFDVFIMPDRHKGTYGMTAFLSQYPAILMMYLTYLIMLLGFLGLSAAIGTFLQLSRTQRIVAGVAAVVTAGLAYLLLLNFATGEMDYGGFDQILPDAVFNLLRIMGLPLAGFAVWHLVVAAYRGKDAIAGFILAALGPYLLVSSCFRPAQRYLMVPVALLVFYFVINPPKPLIKWTPWLVWSSVVVFCIISLVGSVYLRAQGQAAHQMAVWIQDNGYADKTRPGAIAVHAGQFFPVNRRRPFQYVVKSGPAEKPIHQTTMTLWGKDIRRYSLIAVQPEKPGKPNP